MARAFWVLVAIALVLMAVLVGMAWTRAQVAPVGRLARENPRSTALTAQREAEARAKGRAYRVDRRWVPYARISPLLRRAVLIAEDDAFFAHGGLDWNEIQAAARVNLEKRRIVRGGSTITQQLAKNLYTGDARTPMRKLEELFLAMRLEQELSKRRIFELYLNVIEWGDGVFGAEAAARRHFGASASSLTPRQAIVLAAVIINPRRYSPTAPNRRIERRIKLIASRMRRRGFLSEEEYRLALGLAPAVVADTTKKEFQDWFFGAPKDSTTPEPAPPDTSVAPAPDTAEVAAPS